MTSTLALDGFTEIVDLDVPRVDLVDKAANGHRFLLMKGEEAEGLLSTDQVRALAKSHNPTEQPQEAIVTDTITKDDGAGDLDVTEPLAEGSGSALANDPGSPEWEAVDAATAQKWIAVLARAKNALTVLAEREAVEAVSGSDEDAWENEWDLKDGAAAIDYAIDVLASYAAGEQADAADLTKAEAIVKALAPFDLDALGAAESLGSLRKAGRVLSSANESALRDAIDSIQKVLGSLPAAPEIAEEATVTKTETEAPVVKADEPEDDPLTAVFNASGKLIGVAPASAIQPIAGSDAPADDAPAAAAAPALAPAPAAAAGVAADVEKGENADSLEKSNDTGDDLAAVVKKLQEEVEFLKSPARARVAQNGVTPKGELPLAEHDRTGGDLAKGARTDDEIAVLKNAVTNGGTERERSDARDQLNKATLATWQDVRAYAAAQHRR